MSTPQLTVDGLECCAARAHAKLRLVCFGHAGSTGAGAFRRWARALGPAIELWAITLPGRGARAGEPFAHEWQPLIEELAGATAAQVPEPFVLFGHSLGATLAFEVTRELARLGRSPESLIVSARGAPDQTPAFSVPISDGAFLERIEGLYGGVPAHHDRIVAVRAYFDGVDGPEISAVPMQRNEVDPVVAGGSAPHEPVEPPAWAVGFVGNGRTGQLEAGRFQPRPE